MTRICTVCSHATREEVDAALVRRESYRKISARYSVSESALSRHLNDHLARYVHKAFSDYGHEKGVKVLTKLGAMVDRLEAFLDHAEGEGDGAEFRATAGELRKQLELVAKLQGELAQEGTTSIHLHPEWVELRTLIVRALEPHEDARTAVLRAISEAGDDAA